MAEPTDPADPNKPSTPAANPSIEALAKKLQLEQEAEINTLLELQKKKLKEIADTEKNIEEIKSRTKKVLEDNAKTYTDVEQKTKNIKENYDQIVDAEQILKETEEERIRLLQENYKLNQKNYLLLLEEIKSETSDERKKVLELQRDILLAKIKEQANELKNDKDIKKGKEEILSIVKETWQLAKQHGLELEKHIMHISKATGGFAAYNSSLREAGRLSQAATLGTGITGEENLKALEALSDSFASLTLYSKESISSMQVATAQLTKVGVDSVTAAKGFDTLVNAMGKTPQQAAKIQESFVQMAAKNRLALGEVSKAFEQNKDRFVSYGDQMNKVMAGLAEQALKTGVQINGLISVAQGFDTFEDASRKVGTLNALLGGDYFNSIEMLTATDEERIQLLKEGIKASGMQWESLNRQQKQAIATAAGFKDLNDAAKMLGETSLNNSKQQREAADVQKTLAEQAESVSLGMDKLKSTLNGLFIAIEPFVSIFMTLVGWLAQAAQIMNSFFSDTLGLGQQWGAVVTSVIIAVLYSFTRLGGGIRMIGSLFSGIGGKIASFGASIFKAGTQTQTASGGIANGIRTIATAAAQGAIGLLALGAAIFLIGVGIGAAALGFSKLVESFSKLTGEKAQAAFKSIVAIMTGFVLMVGALALMAVYASGPLNLLAESFFVLGVSLVIFGAAVAIISAGLGYLFGSITTLMTTIKEMKSEDITKVFKAIFSELTVTNILSLYKLSTALDNVVDSLTALLNLGGQLAKFIELMNQLGDVGAKIDTSLTKTTSEKSTAQFTVINASENQVSNIPTGPISLMPSSTGVGSSSTKGNQSAVAAPQTVAYFPLIVQIDKTKILEILTTDIQDISDGVASYRIENLTTVQKPFNIDKRQGSQQTGRS